MIEYLVERQDLGSERLRQCFRTLRWHEFGIGPCSGRVAWSRINSVATEVGWHGQSQHSLRPCGSDDTTWVNKSGCSHRLTKGGVNRSWILTLKGWVRLTLTERPQFFTQLINHRLKKKLDVDTMILLYLLPCIVFYVTSFITTIRVLGCYRFCRLVLYWISQLMVFYARYRGRRKRTLEENANYAELVNLDLVQS